MSSHSDLMMRLGGMSSDRFEYLCCRLLPRVSEEYKTMEPSINRDGKTTKGALDAFARLPDGSYIAFAFTTQQTSVPAKVRSDLKKVAALNALVKKVVICLTTQVTLENTLEYEDIAKESGWKLELYSLHRLANCLVDYPDVLAEFPELVSSAKNGTAVLEEIGFLIGERLWVLRQELGLQESEIIKLIDYPSEKAYREIEADERECGSSVLQKLYAAFGVLPAWLTDGTLPRYETEGLMWWQFPKECLDTVFNLHPQCVYLTLQTRKPNDWLGKFADLKDGFLSLWEHGDLEILRHTGRLHVGLLAQTDTYRYRVYDLGAGLNVWEWQRPQVIRTLYRFLHDFIYGSSFEVLGLIIPEGELNGKLYAGYVHPAAVMRQCSLRYGIEWPYEILDLAHERLNTRRGRCRYGLWFLQVQEVFRQALAEKESL